MADPTSLKRWKHKRVVLLEDMRTVGGQTFRAGEVLRVQEAHSNGTFTLKRDPAGITVMRAAFMYSSQGEGGDHG
jgi:hypothetical protein